MRRAMVCAIVLLAAEAASAEHRLIGRTSRSNTLGTALALWENQLVIGGGNFRNQNQRLLARTVNPVTNVRIQLFRRPTTDPLLSGASVAVAGSGLVVGGVTTDPTVADIGKAYLFTAGGQLVRSFVDRHPDVGGQFGSVVAGSAAGALVAVADPADLVEGLFGAGAVSVFDAGVDSPSGALVFTLHAPEPQELDLFGTAVAIVGDRIFVGAPGDDSAALNAGAVHVFDRAAGAWLERIVSPHPVVGGAFGAVLARAGDDLVVGVEVRRSPSGATGGRVYRFGPNGDLRWAAVTSAPYGAAPPSMFVGDRFLAVGLPGAAGSVAGAFAGEVALYDSATGALIETIANPSPADGADEAFGAVVAAVGPYVIAVDRFDQATVGNDRTIYWFADDSRCGDGAVGPGEQCDDGNRESDDGCDVNCQNTGCGNGVVNGDEECDVGDDNDDDRCDATCHFARCGDGRATPGEECDDGNALEGDGCDSNCTESRCGNGIVGGTEQCDTGPDFPPALGCGDNCLPFGVTTTTTTSRTTTTTRAPTTTTTRTTTTTTRSTTTTTRATTTSTTETPTTTTAATTTATVASTTTTTLAAPVCAETRTAGLRCVQESLAGLQIDCAGELVTPAIGRLLDQVQGLVVDMDRAETAGRVRRLRVRVAKLLGKVRKATQRAERTGAIGPACVTEVSGLITGVEASVQAAVPTGQGRRL